MPKSPDIKLVYMPTNEIMKSEAKLNTFRAFSSLDGALDFNKNS